jgi:formylglycine-generating enzyme required for sulfatase activity
MSSNADVARFMCRGVWRAAVAGGSSNVYHFGDDASQLGDYAWYVGNSGDGTHPVGRKKPNAWGLYDMHGNAAEWVLDQFDPSGYGKLKLPTVAGRPALFWPTSLHSRSIRGGSWHDDPRQCRNASRLASNARWQDDDANIKELREAVEVRCFQETRGRIGLVDPELPAAIRRNADQ